MINNQDLSLMGTDSFEPDYRQPYYVGLQVDMSDFKVGLCVLLVIVISPSTGKTQEQETRLRVYAGGM